MRDLERINDHAWSMTGAMFFQCRNARIAEFDARSCALLAGRDSLIEGVDILSPDLVTGLGRGNGYKALGETFRPRACFARRRLGAGKNGF